MDNFLQQLNDSQREAVLYTEGPSLVIAGAGSGKTRVLTYKIAWLLQNGIAPYNVLALTFTNKAAREMKSRIALMVGDDVAKRLWMGTFHSIFSRILRREAEQIGFKSDFTIYDAQDSKNLIKAIVKEKELDDKKYKPAAIQARISQAKNALITPEMYVHDKELIEHDQYSGKAQTGAIYTTYWNRCRTAGVMDFDDLLLYTHQLFNEHPEIVERYRNQFRFILVDEYQDTNKVQHAIVSQLAAEHHRVCVVGDDAQSIYSFRGANLDNILHFKKTYPESKLFKLERNYRSTQTIVNAANSLIQKNKEQIPKKVYSEEQTGEKLAIISAYSDYEEGFVVASRIAEMRMLKSYDYSDFVILYRTNAQSRIFEESLRKINIPYKIYGGLSFYQRKEIKDIISYLRLIVNPNDEEAFKRIINYPTRGIGDTTVGKIVSAATLHNVSVWQVLANPLEYNLKINSGTAKKLDGFRTMMQSFLEVASTQNAYEVGRALVKATGLLSELYEDRTPEGLSRVQNVEELLNSLNEFVTTRTEEGETNVHVGDFLAEISLLTDQDMNDEESANRVTMMTIHAAKGLEFKNVFVVGLEEDLFPSERCKNNPREVEEERRLLYVAITRAEENAILCYAKSRFRNGQPQTCSPSRFLKDIDHEFLKLPSELSFPTPQSRQPQQYHQPSSSQPSQVSPKSQWSQLPPSTTTTATTTTQQTIGNLSIGNTIRHERFGIGEIIALTGENENAKATVNFQTFGSKQLLLKFAKFEVIQ